MGNIRCLMSNIHTLMDLLFPSARQRVLATLLLQPDEGFHLRELARLAGSHAGTLGRELDKLVASGLVQRQARGNQVVYRADRGHPLYPELAALFRKTHGVTAALREALAPVAAQVRVALLFGSMARGTHTASSDVDVLVIGDVTFSALVTALHPTQQMLGREINPVLYTPGEFRTRMSEGGAFAQALRSPSNVLLIGGADELAELAGDPPVAGARG
jgi:predicted nucleotidyltransferase